MTFPARAHPLTSAHMNSLWNEAEASGYVGDLAQRVYTSRLLGREKALVLHGGGNTSVKVTAKNIFGEDEQLLYVKGSGWDLATIDERGFSPVRMAPLLRMAKLAAMTDSQMENELITSMTRAGAPTPSVETILHAALPYKFVDHTHADACRRTTPPPRPALQVRRSHPPRRHHRDHKSSHRRKPHPRNLRRPRRHHSQHHAGIRSPPPLRRNVSAPGQRFDGGHDSHE